MDRISSPEELNDYIRVTAAPVWLILLAIVIILVGTLAWGALGTVSRENADGTYTEVHPITFITN